MFTTNFSETFARTTLGILGTMVFAGLCLMGAAAPAAATPTTVQQTTEPTLAISHADLDLTSRSDRAELDRRIERGARHVCAIVYASNRAIGPEQACVQLAINEAQAQLAAQVSKAGA